MTAASCVSPPADAGAGGGGAAGRGAGATAAGGVVDAVASDGTTAAAGGAKRVHATLDSAQPLAVKGTVVPKGTSQQDDASVDTVKQAHGDHSELGA